MATIVTAYYNLQQEDQYYDYGQGRPHDVYMKHGESVLSIKLPMIIFCSPTVRDTIRTTRDRLCSGIQTLVISLPFDQLPKYKYYDKMMDIKGKIKHNKYSAGYHLVVHSKVDFMLRSATENPFNTNFFIWIDFGIRHISEIPPDIENVILKLVNIDLRLDILNYIPNDVNIKDLIDFCSKNISYVAGGCFMGKKDPLIAFCLKINEYFDYIISNNYLCLEEKLFAFYISNHKNDLDPYISRFHNILFNINHVTKDSDLCLGILKEESNNNNKLTLKLCDYITGSNITDIDKFKVLDIKMLACWYLDKKNLGVLCILEMINLLRNPHVKSLFDNKINYYLNNFSFYINFLKNTLK